MELHADVTTLSEVTRKGIYVLVGNVLYTAHQVFHISKRVYMSFTFSSQYLNLVKSVGNVAFMDPYITCYL